MVTTRPGAYQDRSTLAGFDQVNIDDLSDTAVEVFLRALGGTLCIPRIRLRRQLIRRNCSGRYGRVRASGGWRGILSC